jgi:hypothetical protein
VSAIVWNEKLKQVKSRESEPLQFDYIEEIPSETAQNRDTWSRLSMPSETFDFPNFALDHNGVDKDDEILKTRNL